MNGAAERPPSDFAGILALLAGAAVVVAAIGVRGDFPLSDDWSYAFATRALCTEGALRFLPWTGASLLLQAWYGAALCRLFGFSFEILRLSTVLLAASGAIGFFLLLGRLGIRGGARTLATVVFALDPLYVNLAFTFMTDVPFTVFAVWSGYAYVRGFGDRRRAWIVTGGVLAAAALLIRQHGIFVAAAATLAALLAGDRPSRTRLADALAAGALPALAFAGFQLWLFAWHGAPGGVGSKLTEVGRMNALGVINCAFRGLEYLGLLLAPVAVALGRDLRARHSRLVAASTATLALLALGLYVKEGRVMFYLSNVLFDFGLGASTLRDTLFLALRQPVELGGALGWPLTVVATVAGGLLLTAGWVAASRHVRDPAAAFVLFAATLLFLGTLLHTRYYFDRYLLVVLPFAIASAVTAGTVHLGRSSIVLAALLAWYAVAGTHDYLAWNRARFAGLAELTDRGVAPAEIDGGMEFNAWHLAPALGTWPSDAEVRPGQPDTVKSWWWVIDDRFVASFRPLPRYAVRRSIAYDRWLVPGTGRVVILERETAPTGS